MTAPTFIDPGRCECQTRLDPAAGSIHPACENTPEAAHIRRSYREWRLRLLGRELRDPPPAPRLPRLARHNPDLIKQQ